MSPEEQAEPFDEEAALAELERLRESIQAARRARQRTSEEFEAFIKSFRNPAPTSTSEDAMATSWASEVLEQTPSESIDRSLHSPHLPPSTAAVPSNTDSVSERVAPPVSKVPPRYRVNVRSLGIVFIVAVIALAVVLSRRGREVSPPATVNTITDRAAATREAAVPPPAAVQSPPAIPTAAGVAVELRVIRPVWMRVVVDGRKDVEGTVPAGDPMHLTGDHSIVVRVGNGGDVVIRNGTHDEPFGETGQPRTRTFSKP